MSRRYIRRAGSVLGLVALTAAWSCQPQAAPGSTSIAPPLLEPFGSRLENGDPAAALRALENLWRQGDDPDAIAALRAAAVAALGEVGSYAVGAETYQLRDVRQVHEWWLQRPDILRYRVPVAGDLAPDRLLVLAVVRGGEHVEPAREGSAYVLPAIDLPAALASADPWLVSAALFVARKQDVTLDVDALLARWRSPLPWDAVCTEQALLYLARLPRTELERATAGATAWPSEVTDLVAAGPDGVELQPWLFLASGDWSPDLVVLERGPGLVLELRDSTMDVISERPLAAVDHTVRLATTGNFYSLRYLDGAMHGETRFVDGTAGTYVRLAVAVVGGV